MFFWDQHKTITSCYEKVTGSVCEKYQLTHMEYDILMFLHNNPQHNTAAEIVKVRKSTKSHVSSSLKHIEIVLLNKADLIIEDGIKAQKEFAKIALDGLTMEEKRICKEVFHKICENADKYMR